MGEPILLVFASRNADKIAELRHALAGLPLSVRGAADIPGVPEVEETGATLAENALLKARAVAAATGALALADDTGLEVDALGGAPGVASARFAGPEQDYARNLALLLERMRRVPDGERGARFRTVVAIRFPEGREVLAEGVCEGRILRARRGSGGFGYDPLFWLPVRGKTFAEMSLEEKNLVSHRGRAMRAARVELEAYLEARS
ncbi:MAG: RdgB/HAM1 family non-canonical purine NTP pyrophosphatase [Candidatus Eisenbacteria bacterium]|uniref:dITP/XTP pyrophosphatase n=1 Tax=Eiseniibacteriota bacterium TaxID=2212470 RepID=A0A937XBS5_UNCEI|nr:RdgB/HAM1 family non-canonical purine NTP pyrophosphatase [Candidatus Eisenbacteria bacterium]